MYLRARLRLCVCVCAGVRVCICDCGGLCVADAELEAAGKVILPDRSNSILQHSSFSSGPASPALTEAFGLAQEANTVSFNPKHYPILASHHKTGTVLALEMAWALSGVLNCTTLPQTEWLSSWGWEGWRKQGKAPCFEVLMHWSGELPGPGQLPAATPAARVVHFLRDPLSMCASAYVYHKTLADERWHDQPLEDSCGKASLLSTLCPVIGRGAIPAALANESYSEMLKRLPEEQGLLVELQRCQVDIQEMSKAFEASRNNANVSTVCLEDVTEDSARFSHFWTQQVLNFYGFGKLEDLPDKQRRKLIDEVAKYDLRSGKCETCVTHVTSSSDSAGEQARRAMEAKLAQIDSEYFQGRTGALSTVFGCGIRDQ